MEISEQLCISASFLPGERVFVAQIDLQNLEENAIFTFAQNRHTAGPQSNGYNLTTESIKNM
jgi:hypothetical protein